MSSVFESVSGSVYGVRSIASSIPSSPHSAPPLPSPPTSPHLHGVSLPGSPSSLGSFPSGLSASIWSLDEANVSRRDEDITFSSQEHAESGHQLVIPSLALGPSLVPAPPPRESEVAYGEAIGNVRILILGGQRSLADNLLMRSPQVVHIHGWDHPGGDVTACLEASTILADRDRNVRLTVMPSFDIRDNESTKWAVGQVLQTLHASFQTLHRELHPARAPGPDFTAMLASHRTPLVTAVVLVVSEPITAREHDIISSIASHAPVITLPHPSRRRHHTTRPPTQPQSQTQTRAHSRSNSQGGVECQLLAPPLNRHATQRPHGHDRGRTTLKRSQVSHASPPFAPAPYTSASPPFAPYHSASPPFAPTYPPFSGIASPAFPPRQYVFHLNSISELSHVLFRDPRMLAGLRDAAAARFVAWREREHNPALSPIEPRPTADEERKPVAGLFGFEDPEAGSDFDLGPGSEPSEAGEEDEDVIMGTMWKLKGYGHSQEPGLDVGGTLKPTPGREPLPSFHTTPDSAARPSPPVRHRVKDFGASTIRGDRKEALERSIYHDPLHVPSLVALAVSVLPQMLGQVFGFSTRTNRIRGSASEENGGDDGEDKGWSGLSVILSVGAACAATFCAGWVCGFWMA